MIVEIKKELQESANLKLEVAKSQSGKILKIVNLMIETYKNGGKILLIGNGGSAADAQHIAAELIGRFKINRRGLAAIALTTDSSVITSLSNDYGFEDVFVRQLDALSSEGDMLIAISTSGISPNIIKAAEYAKAKKIKVISFIGKNKTKLAEISDVFISIPSDNTPRIQESHITIGHIICNLVERKLFNE